MSKSFRIGGLSTVYHSPETQKKFEELKKNGQSQASYVAEKIVRFAKRNGYDPLKTYQINEKRQKEISAFCEKARTVSYTYLYAFEYLQSIMEHIPKSTIIRLAILDEDD